MIRRRGVFARLPGFLIAAVGWLGGCSAPAPSPEVPVASVAMADSAPALDTVGTGGAGPPSPVQELHWLSDREGALAELEAQLEALPVRTVQVPDAARSAVGQWRRDGTYAFVNGRFSELQARERPIDFPSHAWYFTEEGTFRRTTERYAWSGRVVWSRADPSLAGAPHWHVLDLVDVATSPPGLPFGETQLALTAFTSADVMLLVLWEDTRRAKPDLIWRFVRYSGLGG